jgi:hypothetical protein
LTKWVTPQTEPSGIGANEALAKYGLYLYVISLVCAHEARNTTGNQTMRYQKRPEKRAREKRARKQRARQKEELRPDRGKATQVGKKNGYCKQTVRGMSVPVV